MRLIDADGLSENIYDNVSTPYEDAVAAKEDCLCAIEEAPTIDAVPVVHGRWTHLGGDEWCCSACGFVITTEGSWDKPTKKYCEDCGAKMDIEVGGDRDAAD